MAEFLHFAISLMEHFLEGIALIINPDEKMSTIYKSPSELIYQILNRALPSRKNHVFHYGTTQIKDFQNLERDLPSLKQYIVTKYFFHRINCPT